MDQPSRGHILLLVMLLVSLGFFLIRKKYNCVDDVMSEKTLIEHDCLGRLNLVNELINFVHLL